MGSHWVWLGSQQLAIRKADDHQPTASSSCQACLWKEVDDDGDLADCVLKRTPPYSSLNLYCYRKTNNPGLTTVFKIRVGFPVCTPLGSSGFASSSAQLLRRGLRPLSRQPSPESDAFASMEGATEGGLSRDPFLTGRVRTGSRGRRRKAGKGAKVYIIISGKLHRYLRPYVSANTNDGIQ